MENTVTSIPVYILSTTNGITKETSASIVWAGSASYVNGIGSVFDLSKGNFTDTPTIKVDIQPITYSNTIAYYPIVTSLSSTNATVRVNKLVNNTDNVVEASTGEVTVNLVCVWSSNNALP